MTLKYAGKNVSQFKFNGATYSSSSKLASGVGLALRLTGEIDSPRNIYPIPLIGVTKNLTNVNGIGFDFFEPVNVNNGYWQHYTKQGFKLLPSEYSLTKTWDGGVGDRKGTFKLINIDTEPALSFTGEVGIEGIYVYAL